MKKRIMAFLAVLVMLLSCLPMGSMLTAEAAEELVLKLHYHREDGSYDGWDVWMWESGRDGGAYPFAEENGEMVATMNVTPGTTSVGFIVRTADWTKDVNEDQFIDIAEMISGTVHIYVESGVKGYTKEYGEDAVTGVKLSGARYDGEKTIITQFTGTIEGDLMSYFKVNGPDGEVTVTEVKAEAGNAYHLIVAEELNAARNYTVICDGTEYKIVMPIIFSTEKFEEQYTYTGNDLGAAYTREKTTFRVWAPTADAVTVRLYESGTEGTDDLIEELSMTADVNGTWVAEKSGDLNGTYYTYFVTIGETQNEACDPYARTTGVNGKRAMVIDLASTNPEGWEKDTDPNAGKNFTDAIIYELHVRDLSSHTSAGITNKGKYLGLTETGTKNKEGISTGIDHIKELGVTHVHLLPVYDFGSVDESRLDVPQFNWGYDPVNYNVPEGSYSTDPYNGEVRVKEFKQMVKSMHDNGLSVIMDVVYNHVYNAGEFCFNKIVPQYFTRIDENGTYSNGSGCGNDTASERSMVKKYIVDSVKYWADEYHIDGFRFDLVGLIDTETINAVVEEVHKTHPNVVFYGEGWTMSTNVTKDGYKMATQVNSEETPGFAYFSDTIRDGLKGSVFNNTETGYISGASGKETVLEYCFIGLAVPWCNTPSQAVNYASCHDNMTLFDRIVNSTPDASREDQIKMNNLAAAFYMTSQGVPFMQAGEEMLRTKPKADGTFDENSYSSSDATNSIKWNTLSKEEYQKVFDYYKGLIAFRKAHGALRMTTAEEVKTNIVTMTGLDDNVMAFKINGGVNGETADNLFVVFNANNTETEIELPEGRWNIYINGEKAGTEVLGTVKGKVTVAPVSAMVLCQDGNARSGISGGVVAGVAGAVAVLGLATAVMIKKKKK
ncbi:MAG: type I pullulanase [Lachnospiraceae bacterium]|nr:type I pullulanase [Lachnospiraceae bacterium]